MDDIRPLKPRKSQTKPQPPALPLVRGSGSQTKQKPIPQTPTALLESGATLDKKLSPRLRRTLIIVTILLLLLGGGIGYTAYWYSDALQPRAATASRVRISIKPGANAQQIGKTLEEKEVIKSSLAFGLYLKQTGMRDKLQAGNYLFSPSQSVKEIVTWLSDGKVDSYNVTILPGKSLGEIKDKLVKDGYEAAEIDAAFAKNYNHPLLKDKPNGVNIEGYIFPETYQISADTTVEQLLIKTFDEFYKRLQAKNLIAQLQARNLTLHKAVTLASLVQLEVATETDRRQVAQVFEKRLQINMPLGSDVSFIYAAKVTGQPISIDIDSPYNTRKYKGLPPGAVANFNFAAIEAVANPAPGDYLYFVSGDDGITHFSRTEQEHLHNVERYCTTLCGR